MDAVTDQLARALAQIVGDRYLITDPSILTSHTVDHTGRYRGMATMLVRPGTAEEVSAVLRTCSTAGHPVTIQGGRTSLVAGTVPWYHDVLLSTERLTEIGVLDTVNRRIRVGAGVTLNTLASHARRSGLQVGVDLASRDSATLGGMASTNAGGLRTVRYGNMREQVQGLELVLPDGSILVRHSEAHSENTGYDLTGLFVGAEGTLGVITAVEMRLHPVPAHHVAAIAGFDCLDNLVAASRMLSGVNGIAALELIDRRASALTSAKLGVTAPVDGSWMLLIELARDDDPSGDLAATLEAVRVAERVAIGMDNVSCERLWRVRESINEILGAFGPPLKFDVALPISQISEFEKRASTLISEKAPHAIPLLFGHVGEGNLHLNVLRCPDAGALYEPMMRLITDMGGNVSSEHGVGTVKRAYVDMARSPAEMAAMRTIKKAFDPTGFLNPAVLFEPPVLSRADAKLSNW